MKRLTAIFGIALMLWAGAAGAATGADSLKALATGGTGGWVNTATPLTAEDFKGRILLLDFWTYGCINCMQVIPDLDYLENKYPQLLVVGVHSAKYTGEGLNDRILTAAQRFSIHHPVLNDNDYKIWDHFGVRAWPTLVVVNGDTGAELARFAGEGHREKLDRIIGASVKDLDAAAARPQAVAVQDTGPLRYPSHLVALPDGNLLVGDTSHHQLVKIDPRSGKVLARYGSGTAGFKDGDAKTAQFNMPRGMALAGDIVYVADTGNHALRAIDASGAVTTLAGNGTRGTDRSPAGTAAKVALASPWDVELMADGRTLAIANAGTHQLWAYDIASKTMRVLAGTGLEDIIDGKAARTALAQPSGLSLFNGDLYFVDAESSSLRVLRHEDDKVDTLIGTGLFDFGRLDGKYPAASLQHPQGVLARNGKLYVADTYNDALRVYDMQSLTLSTLKLQGESLREPGDVAFAGGKLYVTDTGNSRIVAVDPESGAAATVAITE